MKCGSCQTTGPAITVAHVRACYNAKGKTAMVEVPGLGISVPLTNEPAPVLPTRSYVGGNKQTPSTRFVSPDWARVNELQAELNPNLIGEARGARVGYFATNFSGTMKFYRVRYITQGKWKNRTFVDVQASDNYYPVRNRDSLIDVLTALTKDAKAAQLLYAQELGQCFACGRTLTDSESRKLGIGPICRSKI